MNCWRSVGGAANARAGGRRTCRNAALSCYLYSAGCVAYAPVFAHIWSLERVYIGFKFGSGFSILRSQSCRRLRIQLCFHISRIIQFLFKRSLLACDHRRHKEEYGRYESRDTSDGTHQIPIESRWIILTGGHCGANLVAGYRYSPPDKDEFRGDGNSTQPFVEVEPQPRASNRSS